MYVYIYTYLTLTLSYCMLLESSMSCQFLIPQFGAPGRHVGPPSFDARWSVQDMMALDNLSGLAAEDRSTRKVRW